MEQWDVLPAAFSARPPRSANGRRRSEAEGGAPSTARSSATIWFKEPGKPDTWHIVTERLSYGWYRMACAWESRLVNAEGLWPAKTTETGPPRRSRCAACAQGYDLIARLERSLDGRSIGISAR